MENLIHIWNTIVTSNTFNFIVMLFILGWVVKKFALRTSLENLQNKVGQTIKTSEKEKENGLLTLKNAEKSVENLEEEISSNLNQAKSQAENLAKEILEKAENKVKQLELNIKKAVISEEKQISTRLMSDTAKRSSELAKSKIEKLLEDHPELHEKFINESLAELDRIEL